MSQIVTEAIKDIFVQQTSLELNDGPSDMEVEGEISEYSYVHKQRVVPRKLLKCAYHCSESGFYESIRTG